MQLIVLNVFVFLISVVLSCPLDTRVIEEDGGCDVCQCCKFANGDYNVYCNSTGLTSVPAVLPLDTTYLDIRQNPILHLNAHSFPPLPRMKSLLLGNDTRGPLALQTVAPDSFHNLTALMNLTLSINLKNVSTFLSSAMNLKNLTLLCTKSMTQEDYELLFFGLKLDVLEAYNCSFDLVEDTFTNHPNSNAPKTLLAHIDHKYPPRIVLPSTHVGLLYTRRVDSKLVLEVISARTFTKTCNGPTSESCVIFLKSKANYLTESVNMDVEHYRKIGATLWPKSLNLTSCTFRIRNISNDLKEDFLKDVCNPPKIVHKLSLSTDNFPQFSLLGAEFLRNISSSTRDLSLQFYLLGEIIRFDFPLISFTCSNCLLFCEDCLKYSKSLQKVNITDTDSKILIDLSATLKANTELKELILSTNRLTVDLSNITHHSKLVHLELSAINYMTKIRAASNLSALVNLERLIIRNIQDESIQSDSFNMSGLRKLTLLDFSDWKSVVVTGPMDYLFFGLDSLKELRLRNNRFWDHVDLLEKLLKPVAQGLQVLDLSQNAITYIPATIFYEMYNLRRLDLSGNLMTTLNGGIFRDSLQISFLSFRGNNLETVDVSDLDNLMEAYYLREIDLSGNRLHCVCSNRPLQEWLLNGRKTNRLRVHYNEPCPHTSTPTDFMNFTLPWIECDSHLDYVVSTASVVSIFAIISTCVAVFYFRYDIHFWWVVKRRYRINRRYRIDPERKFHAFLSYSSSEQDLAYEIFSKLEAGKDIQFKIAYDHREFLAGFTIAENIIRCIDQSEKVLFLISREFLARDWCEFEMNFAQMRCFDERRNVIILIFVEKFKMLELPKRLRILCRHVNYLQYPDKSDSRAVQNFWHRLRLSLAQDSLLDKDLPVTNDLAKNDSEEEDEEDEDDWDQSGGNSLLRA